MNWRARLDAAAHVLYTPTMLGAWSGRARWHHRIHLIPRWLFVRICDRYEAWLHVPNQSISNIFDYWGEDITDPEVMRQARRVD